MILITGSAGFIGSSLVNELKKKYKIIGLDNLSTGNINNIIKHKNYHFIKGDCGDMRILQKLKKIKIIIHVAGQSSGEKSFEDPLNDFKNNTQSTINLLQFAKEIKCKHFIYMSSMSVYGNKYKTKLSEKFPTSPISFYGISKEASEKYIQKFKDKGLNYTILRLFNVYGSGQRLDNLKQGMIRIYLTQIFKKKSLSVKGSKHRYRDFIHIKDVIKYIKLIINNKKFFNQILNIGTGKKTSINTLVNMIRKKSNLKSKIRYIHGTIDDQFGVVANINKIKKLSKYTPMININDGLEEMIKKYFNS